MSSDVEHGPELETGVRPVLIDIPETDRDLFAHAGHGHDASVLHRLTALSQEEFAENHWGRVPLFTSAERLPSGFDDLFAVESVDELVADRGIRTPFVRMAVEGSVLPPGRYTGSGGFGAEVADQLDSAKVLAEFAAGATLVLQGLHRTWPPLADFTRRLVAELGHPAQVNAYVTPASSRGFDAHYDVHDVFVIQISGEKHWRIHSPVHIDPLRDQPWSDHRAAVETRATEEPVVDRVFRPGDVLYLPRGWIHSATALGDTSVHLTIGVSALTRFDVVELLLATAGQEESLRGSLPLGVGTLPSADLRAVLEQTLERLTDHLTVGVDLDTAVAEPLRRRVPDVTRPEPVRPLATVSAIQALSASTVVRWRSGVGRVLRRGQNRVEIVLKAKSIGFPAEADAALTALAAGAPLSLAALPGLDEASAIVVVRRLLREGVLVVA